MCTFLSLYSIFIPLNSKQKQIKILSTSTSFYQILHPFLPLSEFLRLIQRPTDVWLGTRVLMHRFRLWRSIQHPRLVNVKDLLTVGDYLGVHVSSDGEVLFFEVDTLLETVELLSLAVFYLDFNDVLA